MGPILLRVGYELILLLVMQVKTTREIHQKLTQMTEERGPAAAPGRQQPAPETAARRRKSLRYPAGRTRPCPLSCLRNLVPGLLGPLPRLRQTARKEKNNRLQRAA